ncbi:xaa-Pro aminopeptidase I [Verticillium alfalfae VaMs.102]|uniref:Probable Xaa-Pro aminopeptidase PEPP n=1 Tax=Verticillium alfalfae (strain VaMs.102 / ATCC MYA-4576 / FGSC 10136) TaxID=526221 RepID=AMPP3_VERA1|nr:xaa-Pro aminopeptidase I [Verticillium alfalfae VaMs.102]C9SEV5.1 RecName: Full=Probable Xaa-Pro aminopeptidase PEPP; AltName: Full=Aminoacylproline aminopeptidase; AltName: Full=Prolidase [Verticillium alfalfae VaMs.102]EEY16698.1 xaa-Pro aminopeptidase I [Verticillium alfalfae VaMs.102]
MASGDNVDYEAVMVDEFDALNIEVRVSAGPSSSVPGAALSAPRCPGMRALPLKAPVMSTPVPAAAPLPTPPAVDDGPSAVGVGNVPPAVDDVPSAVDDVVIQKETTKYSAKLHAAKVADELKASAGLVFLPGEPSRTYEYSDMGPAFSSNAATSSTSPASTSLTPRKVLYNGRVPSIKDVLAASDVDEVRHMQDLPAFLHAYAHQHDKATVYLLDASQSHPALVDNARVHIDTAALRPAMDEARVTKTAHEIALIREANAVSSAAHRAVMRHIRRFASERQVAALFTAECTVRGAPTQAYAPIAGSGPNAATLHYGANDEPLAGRHVLVLDAGCEVNCYASDVTRTLPLGPTGHFTPEARHIYDLVERMQEACVAAVAPGLLYYSLHLKASAIALRGLLRLGILKGDEKAIWAAGTVAAFFPHGLGHHIGLETHDVTGRDRLLLAAGEREPRAKRDAVSAEMLVGLAAAVATGPPYRGKQMLRPGMVVTVEPGIYFNKDYIEGYFLREDKHRAFIDRDVLARYYPVGGVRIEDCILVTDDGYENLTKAPKGEDMLRIIRGEAQ